MTNTTTSVFYRVRGQGVRDHEWTKTSQLPAIPPTPPSKPITPLAIPPSPQYSITPTVRIFPSTSSAPSVAVTRPLVSPLTAKAIPLTRNLPRPLTATRMIANPTLKTHSNIQPKPPNPNPTPESPPISLSRHNFRPKPPSTKAPGVSAAQKAAADKQAAATSSALDSLLRDRKRRLPSSVKLPPLPKPIPKTNTQPPPAITAAAAAAASTQPQSSRPMQHTPNVALGVKQELGVQRVLDNRQGNDAAGRNGHGKPAVGRQQGTQPEKSAQPQPNIVRNTSQAVGAEGPVFRDTTEITANADTTSKGREDQDAGKGAKEGRNDALEKPATENIVKEDRRVNAVDKPVAKGTAEDIDGERETDKKRFENLNVNSERGKKEGGAKGANNREKSVEFASTPASRPSRAARLASDHDRELATEEHSREKKRTRTAHLQDEERNDVVRGESALTSFTGCVEVLARVLSMCNTREGMNTEQMAIIRKDARAIIEIRDQIERGSEANGRQKLHSGHLKAPQQSQRVSASESGHKSTRSEARDKERGQTGQETLVVEPLSGKGEITGSGRIDQRRERLEGVHADMFAPGAAARLADISKEYKNLAKKASQLTGTTGDLTPPTDNELIEHVADLNAKAEAMGFVTKMSNYFLTRVEAGSDGGPDASTLKTALNALRDIMQWIGWLLEGVNELSQRCRKLPREHGLVQQFASVMMSLVSEKGGQARNDGILAVLRDIKKAFPSSKEYPGEGNDGKPYFGRRKRVGENVRSILPAFGKTCQWAQKIRTPDPVHAASVKDGDARTAGTAAKSSVPAPTRSGNDMTSGARSNIEPGKQIGKGADTSADVQTRKVQSAVEGTAKRPGPSSRSVGVTEAQIRSERNRVSDAVTSKNGTSGMTELKIPRRPIKKTEAPSSPKVTGPPANVTGAVGRTGMAPLRSAPVTGVEGRPRASSGMTDPAAFVRATLVNASQVERQRAQEERRQFGSSGLVRRGSGMHGGRDGVARAQKRRKVTFANDDELVQGSAGTELEEEEIECLFTDGYDLLGCRNKLQEGAVKDRADELSRGSMMALYGYLRAEFARLKEEAETKRQVAPLETVDLALTPAAIRQVERMLPKPSQKDTGGGSNKQKKT